MGCSSSSIVCGAYLINIPAEDLPHTTGVSANLLVLDHGLVGAHDAPSRGYVSAA